MDVAWLDWEPRPAERELPAGVAHVWRVPVPRDDEGDRRWRRRLAPEERARLSRFHHAADARREAAGRGALRLLLGAYLGIPSERVSFGAGPSGKPVAGGPDGSRPVEFNLAHSGDWALVACARSGRVGVDLERWREIEAEAIVRDFLGPEEAADWRRWPEAERTAAFFTAWTLKEAYLKALGTGLAKDPRSFRVSLGPGTVPALLQCDDDPAAPDRWRLTSLEVAPGYAAAIALERGIDRVIRRTLAPD